MMVDTDARGQNHLGRVSRHESRGFRREKICFPNMHTSGRFPVCTKRGSKRRSGATRMRVGRSGYLKFICEIGFEYVAKSRVRGVV